MIQRADSGPLRVLYCTDTYPPQVNGVSVVSSLTVEGMRDRGWECAVVAPRYPRPDVDPFANGRRDGDVALTAVPSVAFPPYPDIRLAAPLYGEVAAALETLRPHLVHCQTEFILGYLGQRAARRAGIPLVSSYHTDFSRYTKAYRVGWLRGAVSRHIARFHRRSRRVYTPSAPARQDLLALGIRDVQVWGRGVDTEMFHPRWRSDGLRAALELGDAFVFLHVGRLAAEKNVAFLVRAFATARERLSKRAVLIIAGGGPEAESLRRTAPPDVFFMGNMDRRRDLPRVYASADAFLFASETETLGLVVLEAMASGLPVIAAPAGGVADHLRHDVNGLAFPARDHEAMASAIVTLVRDHALRVKLRAGARATAERLSWHHELDALDASYREIVGRN